MLDGSAGKRADSSRMEASVLPCEGISWGGGQRGRPEPHGLSAARPEPSGPSVTHHIPAAWWVSPLSWEGLQVVVGTLWLNLGGEGGDCC